MIFFHRKRIVASFGKNWSVGWVPHEARLRVGFENGGLFGASLANTSVQAWISQVIPSCSRLDPSKTHPVIILNKQFIDQQLIFWLYFSSVRKQVVNIPSFVVRLDSQKHIDFSLKSPFGGGRPGRVKRKNVKKGNAAGAAAEEEDED